VADLGVGPSILSEKKIAEERKAGRASRSLKIQT